MCKNVSLDSSVRYRGKFTGGLVIFPKVQIFYQWFVLLNLCSVYLIPVPVDINCTLLYSVLDPCLSSGCSSQ